MRIFLLISILFFSFSAYADNFAQDRQDLQRLISERATRFNSYTESLKKRSGFFGNKTKNDMRQSNEVLIQIVATDNKIIDAMNRIMSYKVFEKTNINYDAMQVKNKLDQSMFITDTLTKQMNKLELDNKHLSSANLKLKGLIYLFVAAFLTIAFFYFRQKRTARSYPESVG